MLDRRDALSLAGLAALSPLMHRSIHAAASQSPGDRRRELYSLLGDLPDRKRPIGGKKRNEEDATAPPRDVGFDLNGIETVPAYLARPPKVSGRVPAVLFDHSHGGGYTIGKKEFIEGRSYLQPSRMRRR